MIYKKQKFPEANEVIVCTVKKVLPHSIFVELDEYDKEGMIHISEIAPGRIRNIRDYVSEGRKVVCKILSINQEKAHINLSLRRVNQSQKIKKLQEFKQEERAVNILENSFKDMKKEELFAKIVSRIFEKYKSITSCFNEIVNSSLDLTTLKIEKKLADKISSIVREKIKPPEVKIKTKLLLESFQPDGITKIKKILSEIKKVSQSITLLYMGAPAYKIDITSKDYKEAESYLKKITDITEKMSKDLGCKAKFERQDK